MRPQGYDLILLNSFLDAVGVKKGCSQHFVEWDMITNDTSQSPVSVSMPCALPFHRLPGSFYSDYQSLNVKSRGDFLITMMV